MNRLRDYEIIICIIDINNLRLCLFNDFDISCASTSYRAGTMSHYLKGFRSYFKGVLGAPSASCGRFLKSLTTQILCLLKSTPLIMWRQNHSLEIGPEPLYVISLVYIPENLTWRNESDNSSFPI